ncbi:MAG: queuosine precursor transporter [bacterium]|nr:queuosine precursor transporter [bacterium]
MNFKYLDIITGFFVAVLLISNIADTKPITIGLLSFGGGTFLFPIAYIFGDILTEVYGFKRARRVIWIGFACSALMAIVFTLVGMAPPSPDWAYQKDFMNILGLTPRITLASLIAYFFGEFINSVVLAKMKIFTKGKYLWIRTIGSTIVGELVDTTIFMFIAFFGVFPLSLIFSIIISGYFLKVITEVMFTPVTYWIVNILKKKEHEDYYDTKTKFTPFEIDVK